MAQNIFEQLGLKEVANVQFEALEDDPRLGVEAGDIVMYLDTLKVSTTEITGDQTEAKGGWGNPSLIIWDFNKEINITLTDALFTMQSLAVMTGAAVKEASSGGKVNVRYNEELIAAASMTLKHEPVGEVKWIDLTNGKRGKITSAAKVVELTGMTGVSAGDRVRFFYDVETDGSTDKTCYEVTISAANFPGTYRIFGDTLVRNRNGKDAPYQFIVNRAKVNSEVTFTMEARKSFGFLKLCELLEAVA